MPERRNDIGMKVVLGALGIILGIFFNHTYSVSKEAYGMATESKKDVAVMQEGIKNIDKNICKIDAKLEKLLDGRYETLSRLPKTDPMRNSAN